MKKKNERLNPKDQTKIEEVKNPQEKPKKRHRVLRGFLKAGMVVLTIVVTTVVTYTILKFAKVEKMDDVDGSKVEDHRGFGSENDVDQSDTDSKGYKTDRYYESQPMEEKSTPQETPANPWGAVDTDSDEISNEK